MECRGRKFKSCPPDQNQPALMRIEKEKMMGALAFRPQMSEERLLELAYERLKDLAKTGSLSLEFSGGEYVLTYWRSDKEYIEKKGKHLCDCIFPMPVNFYNEKD